ncbi:MAG: RICIN domain-containing protein [Clostridia bacterium]|nr:RICIN domain-containing protein [Clostridia bacterium]
MKKVLSILLCAVMFLSSANLVFAFEEPQKVYTVNLDLNNKSPFGEFEGWGTSICWWGHHLGENLTDEQLDSVVKALYDEEEGLGLNIARYNIGGGDDPTHNHQREFDGRDMPGLTDADGKWNLGNDAGQIKALQLAVKYGADILEAFSNSPPYYMTESGCSSGNHNSGENNLPDDKFDDFAEYLAEAVLRIQKEYGVKFDTLEPFNESDTNYWGYEGWQEGCHFDVEDHSRLILLVRDALDKRGLTDVGVAAADETNVWRTGENIKNVYTDEAIDALSQVNTHSYSVGDYNHTRNAVLEAGKPLYMTEVDGDGSIGGEKSGNMGPALWFSNKINEDLRGLEPNAWVMWQAVAMAYDGEHKDSGYWNIMSIDKETSELHKTKKYYAYMQYTKFIRPGDTLVKTDYSNIVSAINEEDGKVVFVITNMDSASKNYNLNAESLGMTVESVESYVTSQSYDCAKIDIGELYYNEYSAQIPPYSVATVVFNGKMEGKSIKLTEKDNTVTAFVGEELEFTVTDENGNVVDAEIKVELGCKCLIDLTFNGNKLVFNEAHDSVKIVAVKDGLKAKYPINIIDGDNDTVRIIGSGSERALKVSGSDVVIADRDSTPAQQWVMDKHGEYYSFRNEKTGKYLSTDSFLTTSVLDDKALWKLEKDKGMYRIINKANEESIDVYNHATEVGSQVGVYGGYYGTPNQLFYFEAPVYEPSVEVEYMAGEIELTGTPFGTNPWDGDENVTADKAWDGDKETFFHAGRNDDRTGYTAIDLGENHLPFNKVTINSRPGFEYRGWEAVLSGSNEKDGEYTVIHTFSEEDFQRGEFASVKLSEYVDYRYIKYETPNGGYTNVGEVNLIYAPEKPICKLEGDVLRVTGGRTKLISYYDGDVLKKIETTTKSAIVLTDEYTDIRIQVINSENNLLATFFIKKY